MNNDNYYTKNFEYALVLERHSKITFNKYIDTIERLAEPRSKFLDVGCGTGNVIEEIDKKIVSYGIDVSDNFIEKCRSKGLNCLLYDGHSFPFQRCFFDIVGSYNVLEHVDDPFVFLDEQLRVLKNGGHLVIVCPNFLSISNNYHWHTAGFKQKIKNIYSTITKIFIKKYDFSKMEIIKRADFHPDDDACNVTNPVDIIGWSQKNHLELLFWSSQPIYRKNFILNSIDKTFFRVFLGACFFVFQKP